MFLAGDAAHTHSSGAAQVSPARRVVMCAAAHMPSCVLEGMNTGIHDATNLAWKLAGVLKGHLHEDVLNTYEFERRSSAQHLIELDRDVASLISGRIPDHFNAPPHADVNSYLDQVFTANAAFTVGLGISYAGIC